MKSYKDIDEYIAASPTDIQDKLTSMRQTIQKAAPQATEKIGYGIPTFVFHGNLVHFAGYDTHIGFYPGAAGVEVFIDELKDYKTSKGTIQFPLDKPLPLALITKITKFRVSQNLTRKK